MAVLFAGLLTLAALDPDGLTPGPTVTATISSDTLNAAAEANVPVVDLLGAMSSTGSNARQYLLDVGELAPPKPPPPAVPARVQQLAECIIWRESRGNPNAVNRSSQASGLGQFLPSTWRTTPAGRAGLSVFDAQANRAMVVWMIQTGRTREFVTAAGC